MQDNNCDDPHADLVMSKKALSLFQEEEEHGQRKTKRKVIIFLTLFHKILPILIFDFHQARTMEYYKQRFRKNLAQLLEEEAGEQEGEVIGVLSELSIFNLNYLDLGAILGDTVA